MVPPAGGNSHQVADAALATWNGIQAALSPIIGDRGLEALYRRSLYLARTAFPCLADAEPRLAGGSDFEALHTMLARQSDTDAAGASAHLLQTFHDLLASLIGQPLTQQLLRPVAHPIEGGPPPGTPHHDR